jgi:hypothetical protein
MTRGVLQDCLLYLLQTLHQTTASLSLEQERSTATIVLSKDVDDIGPGLRHHNQVLEVLQVLCSTVTGLQTIRQGTTDCQAIDTQLVQY